jgi:hypothetical protein
MSLWTIYSLKLLEDLEWVGCVIADGARWVPTFGIQFTRVQSSQEGMTCSFNQLRLFNYSVLLIKKPKHKIHDCKDKIPNASHVKTLNLIKQHMTSPVLKSHNVDTLPTLVSHV